METNPPGPDTPELPDPLPPDEPEPVPDPDPTPLPSPLERPGVDSPIVDLAAARVHRRTGGRPPSRRRPRRPRARGLLQVVCPDHPPAA